jgi:allantoate deiminase
MPECKPDAERIMSRCEALAQCSEEAGALTRIFLSAEQRAASALVTTWMQAAGMTVKIDAIGNVVGRYEGECPGLPCLMFGSHLDTIRNAGKYDGMLGVIATIDCVQVLADQGRRLPFAIEIVGFADEEGVRFGATLLGSRAVAGTFDQALLKARDGSGMGFVEAMSAFGLDAGRISEAARRKDEILAYAELHIEQGPVLEAEGLPVGVVTAINGFSRARMTLTGYAGHAGTVPMALRRDALTAAAECVLAIEDIARNEPDLVGTVGRIEAAPGAINVIPGSAVFTLDVRSPRDAVREPGIARMLAACEAICASRNVSFAVERLQDHSATVCAGWLMSQFDAAVAAEGVRLMHLPSGAGHDGMAMRAIADIAMLFIRCEGGVSHNPAEAITAADAGTGARVLSRFIENFQVPEK